MLVLGVVLVILGAGFAAAAVVGGWGTQAHPVDFAIATVSDWTSAAVFLAGMGSMLVLALGVWLLYRGTRRRARDYRSSRAARREERRAAKAQPAGETTVVPPEDPGVTGP